MELKELETNEKKESGKVENVTPKAIETGMILSIVYKKKTFFVLKRGP